VTGKIPTIALGEPHPADVTALEAELSQLWRSAAEDPSTRDAVTRACTLTLLVYVEREEYAWPISNLISEVTRQNPCRAIVIAAEPQSSPAGITASISAHCSLPAPGAKQVCCEQITLIARGDAVENLDNVVLPLAVPGLPVHIWWRASRFGPPHYFSQILRVASHLLFDSARLENSEANLSTLSARVRELAGQIAVTDLNWARLTPWRELMAQFFDSPETRPYLEALREVRIEYDRTAPAMSDRRGRILLFIGWLASRLGWEPESHWGDAGAEKRSFHLRSGKEMVEAVIAPREFPGEGPAVQFTLVSKASQGLATFSMAGALGRQSMLTRVELPGRSPVERIVHLPVSDEVELLNEELKLVRRDRVYEAALEMLGRMTGA
jgi:glucose-6-phosphate dehydrogenase assembly protein OpcA